MIEIEGYPDDVFISTSDGDSGFLRDLIQKEMAFVDAYMCKENAEVLYRIKCALELAASEIQAWYDDWKNKGFEK